MSHLGKLSEEFNNFMYKVNEVNGIVKKLASNDKDLQQIGCLEADKLLGVKESIVESIDENNFIELKVKTNRTVINKKAIEAEEARNSGTMSQRAFMEEVEKDANMRHKNKMIRKEKSETFKKQAMLAFKRGEYELALSRYNKAIEQIRDNCALYLDRAVTEIKLKLYDRAVSDCQMGLKLNENSLRAWLLSAKSNYLNQNYREFESDIKEAKTRCPNKNNFIEEYVQEIKDTANE